MELHAGTAEPGSVVRVVVDGKEVCSTVAAEDGSWTCTAEIGAGEHEVTVTATDAAGNTSRASVGVRFGVTTALTAPVITTPAAGAFLTSTEVRFTGMAISATTVTVYDAAGSALCAAEVDATGTFTCVGTARRGANAVHAVSTWNDLESLVSAQVDFTVAGAGHFAGGGCSASAGSTSVWGLVALCGLALLRRRSRSE